MKGYTLRRRALALYDDELASLLDEHVGEFQADAVTTRVTRTLLATLLELSPDVAEQELEGVVAGWCREHERERAAQTYREGQLFPHADHVFVLGEGLRVFARDATERHLAARVRVVTENVRRQMAAANVELEGLAACQDALADARPGATLADVGALQAEDDEP